jgi:hypothetical protein
MLPYTMMPVGRVGEADGAGRERVCRHEGRPLFELAAAGDVAVRWRRISTPPVVFSGIRRVSRPPVNSLIQIVPT